MINLVLMKENPEITSLSQELGFEKTFFLERDFVLIGGDNRKEILQKTGLAQKKGQLVVYRAASEETLLFVLERTAIKMVLGVEKIHPRDSLHYLRSGWGQVLCRIAAEQGKVAAFSFNDILNSPNRPQLLARMIFNIELCQKYKVGTFFSNFSHHLQEMRSAQDLATVWKLLGGS